MTASSFQIFVFSVLASPIIADLGLSRGTLGLLGSLNTLVGALSAPLTGKITDRIGARRSAVIVLVISAIGMAVLGLAGHWWVLALGALISGIPQGWGNPATNTLISTRVPQGAQGVLTGVKQSGVQVGVFLSGLTLPALAILFDWRGAVWVYAGVFAGFAALIAVVLEPDDGDEIAARTRASAERAGSTTEATRPPLDPAIIPIAVYAFLMGSAGGAAGRFLSLYAEEVMGFTTGAAGAVVAIGGLLGIASRIGTARIAEHRVNPVRLLGVLSIIGTAYCLLLLFVPELGNGALWFSPLPYAIGIAAWNAVAMLAVITRTPRSQAGRASGVVMVGFLGGLSVGTPVAGWTVDVTGSYRPMWIGATVLTLIATVVVAATDVGLKGRSRSATGRTSRAGSTPPSR
ncbi:MAG: MFS transporter [Actinomycetota bacterium]|nr:MFS transporter [Actinomycetota bacterium]